MSLLIVLKKDQAKGQFNGGAILEDKPIGFPQDGGDVKPYSNILYWAHAWTSEGSTIGEHPHRGFEIMSFILKGTIEHYDSKNKDLPTGQAGWRKLNTGDVQIIRAGDGITHAEKMNAGSSMFQIWFDPDLNKTLSKPASYDDYASDMFPVSSENGITTKIYKGENAPIKMDTEGIVIKEMSFPAKEHTLNLYQETVYSVFLLDGTIEIDVPGKMEEGDFVIIREQDEFKFNSTTDSKLFIIESPLRPSYQTYAEMKI